ncbi:MCE family protein [Gandjariella thermophila]|uniref:ABC transporter substrate-binding protein n=1 Tax=Gandjariella thermophila TaxID=1931992 RepID=A0A4D4J3T6_9PSEU|nr:MCE family protein [Gandjariella thermophila]GDY29760.1 ABC transporter substrate-binding protein [Gandjariella thermophila]
MTVNTRPSRNLLRLLALACVVALAAAGVLWWVRRDTGTHLTAYFDKTVGLYAGSTVRVLGVQVGHVDRVQPQGDVVRVDMSIDPTVPVPASAKAVMVAPSLVSDRYVQLTPAYTGGPRMAEGAVIPREHTATPMELDDLYRSANQLSQALGPNGANAGGALSDLLNTGAANLAGNGQNLNDVIRNLGDAAAALSDSKGDLFATIDNLNKFTATLAASDADIREFSNRLADVSSFLASDSNQMGTSLAAMADALNDVNGFVKNNKDLLQSNVDNLAGVTRALVDQRAAVAEILDVAPLAATNFVNTYDAPSAAIAVRGTFNEFTYPPVLMVCVLLRLSTPKNVPPTLTDTCQKLAPVLDGTLKLPTVNDVIASLQQGKTPSLPLPLVDAMRQAGELPAAKGGGSR